jgi:hypothetical protein
MAPMNTKGRCKIADVANVAHMECRGCVCMDEARGCVKGGRATGGIADVARCCRGESRGVTRPGRPGHVCWERRESDACWTWGPPLAAVAQAGVAAASAGEAAGSAGASREATGGRAARNIAEREGDVKQPCAFAVRAYAQDCRKIMCGGGLQQWCHSRNMPP